MFGDGFGGVFNGVDEGGFLVGGVAAPDALAFVVEDVGEGDAAEAGGALNGKHLVDRAGVVVVLEEGVDAFVVAALDVGVDEDDVLVFGEVALDVAGILHDVVADGTVDAPGFNDDHLAVELGFGEFGAAEVVLVGEVADGNGFGHPAKA